jgi:aspartate kinase
MERSTQFIGRVFHILDEHGLSIDLITTSETYISLTFDNYEGNGQTQRSLKALEALRAICIVDVSPELDLITVVGNNLDAKSGGAGRVFEVLDNIKVRMICYGANPHNISFLVENTTSTAVIQKLHKHLLISNKKQP